MERIEEEMDLDTLSKTKSSKRIFQDMFISSEFSFILLLIM